MTPAQKAEGARAVLAELQRLHTARLDFMALAIGVREICDHYSLPFPPSLAEPGAFESLRAISAAVDQYAEFCQFGEKLFEETHASGDGATGEGSAASPAPAVALAV